MLKKIGRPFHKILHSFGYKISSLNSTIPKSTESNWAEKLGIKTIIDIGSNEGQFINEIEVVLPGRKIYAFEPMAACYQKLLANTAASNVTAYNAGLSDTDGQAEINVSNNLVSSSILEMEELHKNSYPESQYVKKETITLKRLDSVFSGTELAENILIKVDVQGYEEKVIRGGEQTFARAAAIIIESIFEPFYEGQWLFDDIYQHFSRAGFKFMGFADQVNSRHTGIPIYADAIFIKKELVPKIL
jgi:FkbM family methyltransferase